MIVKSNWIRSQVKLAFGGRLIGKTAMKKIVCEVVSRLPENLRLFVTSNVWIIASSDEAWAMTFRGSDIKNQFLIVLTDELFKQKKGQIQFTILHELGHVIMGHRNSIGFKQSKEEILKQENEADEFAEQFSV